MTNLDTNEKKCSYGFKAIGTNEKYIQCVTCHRFYHATTTCMKSSHANETNMIEACEKCIN